VEHVKGMSDHYMLMCELMINPKNQPLPTLMHKMIKPEPTVALIRKTLDSKEIKEKIVKGEIMIKEPIKPAVIKMVKERARLPNIRVAKPAGYSMYDNNIDKVEGEFVGCYLTKKARSLATLFESQGKKMTPADWKRLKQYLMGCESHDNPCVRSLKYVDSEGVVCVTADQQRVDELIKDKFEELFYDADVME